METSAAFRKTTQYLMPARRSNTPAGQYDIYPAFNIGADKIHLGYPKLANRLSVERQVVMDGYPGVLWEIFQAGLDAELRRLGITAAWHDVSAALLPASQIDMLVDPYLGGTDPLFGNRFHGELADFFDPAGLGALCPDPSVSLNILYGCGAALAGWEGLLVYLDVPKNEIQFRFRSGSLRNLGSVSRVSPKQAYKRCYFVDWVVANRHKAHLLPKLDLVVDEQRPAEPVFCTGAELRAGLSQMAHNYFRVRPWFEPGPWGGQWIKKKIPQLAQDVPNYAWSFELIVPENGLVFQSDDVQLEVSFDYLMFQEYSAVLGESASEFQAAFPIRFDFLDTFDGGNLSIQVHPRPEYIRAHFGETFTQDETYYILDCAPGARVYLGFQADIDPAAFRAALEHSAETGAPVDIDRYVNSVPVNAHDLILIPNGTIHGSGQDNLVLEISATPYIFTFKMYDWLRMDLDGKPRSLNIARAFENLFFDRKGQRVLDEFVSKPIVLQEDKNWRLVHCPTHPNHFYDIHRLEFNRGVDVALDGSCHVLSLVEGQTVLLETGQGLRQRFNYAETFVIPAAAGHYRLVSESGEWIKVVKCFIKPKTHWAPGVLP